MSAKTRFLQKLQTTQLCSNSSANTGQADLATFQQRLTMLRESVEGWLTGTGIRITDSSCMLTEMLISHSSLSMPCFSLHFQNRTIVFTPLFLYGQGVTGCVEVTLVANGQTSSLARLFMRSTESREWTYKVMNQCGGRRTVFDEDAFFGVVESLLS